MINLEKLINEGKMLYDEYGNIDAEYILNLIEQDKDFKVDNQNTFDLVRDKEAKNNIDVMLKCCQVEINRYVGIGLPPAPVCFERVAILAQKNGNINLAIRICEIYIDATNHYFLKNNITAGRIDMCDRLEKLKSKKSGLRKY